MVRPGGGSEMETSTGWGRLVVEQRIRLGGCGLLVVDGGLYLLHQLWRNICEAMIGAGVLRCLLHDFLLGLSFGYEIAIHPDVATV